MFKKIPILILTVLLSITLISCKTSGDKIVLKIGFWPESQQIRDVEMYNEWKEAFENDYPQYEIVPDPYTYDTTTVGSKYITGTLPTVFQAWFTEPQKLKDKHYIRPITALLEENGWLSDMDPEMRSALTFDGELYGIPRDGYGLGLLINIKTLGDNGLLPEDEDGNYLLYNEDGSPAYPTTFEEIYQDALTIQEYDETKGILILSANKNGGWQFSNFAWNYGATLEYQDNDGNWIANLDSEECINALDWIKKMKSDDLLLDKVSIYYDEWYNAIESKVAMAIVGSDVIKLATTSGGVNMDDLAFVPMPTGDGVHHYSLYGGTPYVFSADATDEQVEGVLKFFEYVGRTPMVSDISKAAMVRGYETSVLKGEPILPQIYPWVNDEYVSYANQLEAQYETVNMDYFSEFFNTIKDNKHSEVPYYAQDMYEFLDTAIQNVLSAPDTANTESLLRTANAKLQKLLDDNINNR